MASVTHRPTQPEAQEVSVPKEHRLLIRNEVPAPPWRLSDPTTASRLPVLLFDPDGQASGFVSQSEADLSSERARAFTAGAELARELISDKGLAWLPEPLPPPGQWPSGRCAARWPAEIDGEYVCSLVPGHQPGCEAHGPDGAIVCRHDEPTRKPSPRPRKPRTPKTAQVTA
jgi:hypothetical protein